MVVNGEDCKRYGKDSHWKAAKLACDNTMVSRQACTTGTSVFEFEFMLSSSVEQKAWCGMTCRAAAAAAQF
jgi:hypothetical protein